MYTITNIPLTKIPIKEEIRMMREKPRFDTFDIMGPIMIGPSSSHTAGAVRIGLMAGQLCNYEPASIEVLFHGSLASTYSFHKTDVAVIAGAMGIPVDDERIRESLKIAESRNIDVRFGTIDIKGAHPSTILIKLKDKNSKEYVVRTATIGGGNILIEEVNGVKFNSDGKQYNILVDMNTEDESQLETIVKKEIGLNYRIGIKENKSTKYFSIINKEKVDTSILEMLRSNSQVRDVYYFIPIMAASISAAEPFNSIEELVNKSKAEDCKISDTIIKFEAMNSGRSEEDVISEMRKHFVAMKESIKNGSERDNIMLANIFGGNAKKMSEFISNGRSICGVSLSKVIRNALAVMEVNGSMGKVVACPTAGSAGTVPSAVLTIAEENGIEDERVVRALFTGAGIGSIIADGATISGSVGGCQAENGAASAMAAAVITELFGGDLGQVTSSASIALGNVLGLVCDPVAGTVELPCIQRNVMAAANAIVSAEMALAGVDSVIPLDEMIGALNEVGNLMDISLKDTLGSGISNTPTARRIEGELFKG